MQNLILKRKKQTDASGKSQSDKSLRCKQERKKETHKMAPPTNTQRQKIKRKHISDVSVIGNADRRRETGKHGCLKVYKEAGERKNAAPLRKENKEHKKKIQLMSTRRNSRTREMKRNIGVSRKRKR